MTFARDSRSFPLYAALLAAALAVALLAGACGGDEEERQPTVVPGPDKTFGDPGATVTVTEYFDYR
jgi:hypothetical protein